MMSKNKKEENRKIGQFAQGSISTKAQKISQEISIPVFVWYIGTM